MKKTTQLLFLFVGLFAFLGHEKFISISNEERFTISCFLILGILYITRIKVNHRFRLLLKVTLAILCIAFLYVYIF